MKRYGLLALALSPLVPPVVMPGAGGLVSFAIVIASLLFVRSVREPTLAFVSGSLGRSIAWGVAGGLVAGLVALACDPLIERLTGQPIDLSNFAGVRGNLRAYLLLLAVGIGIGGVLEELTFRGFVVGAGTRFAGERSAVWLMLLSAVLFGIAHAYQGISGMISTGISGLLFGAIYLLGGRKLLPAMLAHATTNVIGVTAIYLGYIGPAASASA